MAEETAPAAEPSMEEILASIRKIISDENVPVAEPAATEPQEDVLELTQMVQDDGKVEAVAPPPPVVEAPRPPAPPPPPVAAVCAFRILWCLRPVANTAASALSSLANTVEIERLTSASGGTTFNRQWRAHAGRYDDRVDAAFVKIVAGQQLAGHC